MSNIVLTDVCNLKCPYCFAGEFVNHSTNEISMENFRIAKDFILTGKSRSVGLIGGEPLLHSNFRGILQDLIADPRVAQAVVYTNGIHCHRFIDEFCSDKFRFLVNCNPPSDIGDAAFAQLEENLDLMLRRRYLKGRMTLGINMYKPDFEYDYILALLKRYGLTGVRVSITVPSGECSQKGRALADFQRLKPRMLEFFHILQENGIQPHYDCNKIPLCCLTEEEARFCQALFKDEKDINRRDVHFVRCNPVIDILQDLTAIRCFGLSQHTKQDIRNFANIEELRAFYQRSIDCFAANTACDSACIDCRQRLLGKCYGGCLTYKMGDILALQQTCLQIMGQ